MIICFDKYLRSFSNILRLFYDGFGYPPTNWGLELQNIGFCDADDSDGDSGEYDSDGDSDDDDSDGDSDDDDSDGDSDDGDSDGHDSDGHDAERYW